MAHPLLGTLGGVALEFHTVRLKSATDVAERARDRWRESWRLRALLLAGVLVAGAWAASHPGALVEWATRPRATAAVPDSTEALGDLVRQVEEASAAGQHAEVARLCATIVEGYPDHPVAEPARVRYLQASMEIGDVRAAEEALVDFCRRHPDSPLLPEVLLHVATWQYERGKYGAAAQTWTDLIAATTRNGIGEGSEDAAARPVIVRSLSLWRKIQREERSRTQLERLARFNQALSWQLAGDGESALRAYDRFLARFPEDGHAPEARFRLANLLLERDFADEALDFYRTVYEDPNADPEFRCESVYRAGRSQEQRRRTEAAVEIYGHALDLVPPDHPLRLASLTQLAQLVEQREPGRALAIYRELANTSSEPAVRAVALQRLRILEGGSSEPPAQP